MKKDVIISIIIPVYDREKKIIDCISSLINQDFPKNRYEIIVVDNNSIDNSVQNIKRFKDVKLFYEKKQSSYAARNLGVNKSIGHILFFTDSDCIIKRDCLKRIKAGFKNKKIDIIKGNVRIMDTNSLLEAYLQEYYNRKINNKSFYFETNCMAIKKDVLARLGLFDGNFFSGGDNDLSIRARKAGLGVKYDKELIVHHSCRRDLWSFFKRYIYTGRGKITLLKKYNRNRILDELFNPKNYLLIFYQIIIFVIGYGISIIKPKKNRKKIYWPLFKVVESLGYRIGLFVESVCTIIRD